MSAGVRPGPTGAGRAVAAQALLLGGSLSLVNGFVVASLQGAVGVVGREQTMLRIWVAATVLLLPVYTVVVLGVLRSVARRRAARSAAGSAAGGRPLAAVGLVAAAAALLGSLVVVGFAVWDTHVQDQQVESVAWTHFHAAGTDPVAYGGKAGCDAVCVVEAHTRAAHVRAVVRAVPVTAALDGVVVLWLLAAFGGVVAMPAPRASRRLVAADLAELVGTP